MALPWIQSDTVDTWLPNLNSWLVQFGPGLTFMIRCFYINFSLKVVTWMRNPECGVNVAFDEIMISNSVLFLRTSRFDFCLLLWLIWLHLWWGKTLLLGESSTMSNLGNEMKARYRAPHSDYVVTTTSEFEPLKWKLDFLFFSASLHRFRFNIERGVVSFSFHDYQVIQNAVPLRFPPWKYST